MDEHKWSLNEVTNLYNRIIASENLLAKLERETKSQIEFLSKEQAVQKTLTEANRSWIKICDDSIKELRNKENPAQTSKPIREYKPNWKFWK